MRWIFSLFRPTGYALICADGRRYNVIRGDLVPAKTLVIIQDDRHFVRSGEKDVNGFKVFREDVRSFHYLPS